MDFLTELAQQLYERRDQAVIVLFRDWSNFGFLPIEQACHSNVEEWCRNHPEHRPVRGWLVNDSWLPLGYCSFVAHSVVQDERGGLFDPTPTRAVRRYAFLRHHLTDEEFVLMVSARRIIHLQYCFDAGG